jgi:type III restriction enzyme
MIRSQHENRKRRIPLKSRLASIAATRPRYVPDFILETDAGLNVIVEIKGQVTDAADIKAKAAQRWVSAVNRLGQHGTWNYLLVTDPGTLGKALNAYAAAQWAEGPFELT